MTRRPSYFGLLNLNKPPGMTSRWVVDVVQDLVRPEKVGHAGTLDPLATGVLMVCVGPATRLIDYLHRMPKRYVATFLLGRESDTEDVDGQVTMLDGAPQPSAEQIIAASRAFLGNIEQRPPNFSALKIGGERAYKKARRGESVKIAPRAVTIHTIELVRYEYPELELDIACGSGTYIRSLGRDLARSLGTGAVMSALVRTEIGPFKIEAARDPEQLTLDVLPEWLLPPRMALGPMPSLALSDRDVSRLANGGLIRAADYPQANIAELRELVGTTADGTLAAIFTAKEPGVFKPTINFADCV